LEELAAVEKVARWVAAVGLAAAPAKVGVSATPPRGTPGAGSGPR
jgi:hypothetical protein